MQGLNNLAYASGLDNPRQTSSYSQQQDGSSSRYSTKSNAATNRTQSPMQGTEQPQYSTIQQSSYDPYDRIVPSTSSPQLAISAAQALAGAVSRKYQQSAGAQKTTSAALSSGTSVQRTNRPYSTSSNTQSHVVGLSGLSQASQPQQKTQRVKSPGELQKQTAAISQNRGSQHNSGASQTPRSAAQATSISNLVSTTQEPQTSAIMATEPMPAFIDPTQVFNPYHKEHERRRREVAEAEVRRKQQEAATAKAQEEQKRKEAKAVEDTKAPLNEATDDNAAPKATSPVEDAMALEMKLMMEKMKEFRTRDPSLFQKLWEDVRKGGGGGAASNAVNAAAPVASDSATPAPSTSPQVAQQSELAGQSQESGPPAWKKARTRLPKSQQPPSAASRLNLPGNPPANGWKVVVEDNEEGFPDLGRYPAERHIRGTYQPKRPTPTMQTSAASAGSFQMVGLENGPTTNLHRPARTASGGVEWPKDKRDALAASAIEALKANPENEEVGVTSAVIHTMLEQNPSYIQLCDLLEKKGLKFHRGQFARQLLSSVPDLSTPQKGKDASQPPPTPTSLPPSVQQQRQPAPPPVPSQGQQQPTLVAHPPTQLPPGTMSAAPPHMLPNGFVPGHPLPLMPPNAFVPGPPIPFQAQAPFPSQHVPYPYIPSGIKPEPKVFPSQKPPKPKKTLTVPSQPEPPPGSKEAMARKRAFSELIDLTTLSDNEDYVLSSKHPRMESPSPEPDPFEAYRLQQNLQANIVAPELFVSNSMGLPERAPLKFNPMQPARTPAPFPAAPQQKPRTILARAVDKKEALRKSYYDPKTVARDILIAAGRHPTERPLNAHMAGLLGLHIDLDSDLSTFDWDAIDPGGPPAPRVKYVDIPAGPPRFKIGDMVRRPGPRPRAEAEREPRAVESGKRETQGPPAPTRKGPPIGKFKTAVIRTTNDLVKARSESKRSGLRESQAVADDTACAPAATPQKHKPKDSSPGGRSPRSTSRHGRKSMDNDTMSSGGMYLSGKKRGRPFGSKNKQPTLTTMKKAARPQPLVEIPAPSSSPQGHPIFKCRWRSCHAELHNLDTLRKHISRKHHPTEEEFADHGYICWWKKCKYLIQDGDKISVEHNFDNPEDWMEHITEDHLHKIALKLGDGPSAAQIGKHTSTSLDVSKYFYEPNSKASARTFSYTDPQSMAQAKPRYLSDPKGRATTPSVSEKRNPDLPPDTLLLTKAKGESANSDMAAQKSFLKAHHRDQKIGAKMNAEELLRAMEKRKRDIGPGIDRGGCTLVNEARRSTFVQNPGIRRVVDADY